MSNYTKNDLKARIAEKLKTHFGREPESATRDQFFRACALVTRDELSSRLADTREAVRTGKKRQVHYLSMEFLVGRSLYNNAFNLGMADAMRGALADFGINMSDLLEMEPDPGLGNGGLGRLAACYLDSMATQEIFGSGYSIRYRHGVFRQRIIDGVQAELPDSWLDEGENFMIPQLHHTQEVRFGGNIEEYWQDGRMKINHTGYTPVLAVPYDMPISGYGTDCVAPLMLWDSKSPVEIDMGLFAKGEYLKAVEQNALAEVISMVLYPEDNHPEGQSLRLKQQYFFVSATIQYILSAHRETYGTLSNFAEKNVIHINDTHPALVVPELMRLLLDEEGMSWEDAWSIVTNCVAYTNHTVMAEALEHWPVPLFDLLLPRITAIIREIDRRHRGEMRMRGLSDQAIRESAVIEDGVIHMAHLAIVGGYSVNGVSALHSNILTDRVFRIFAESSHGKFGNVTNGIAHRRWLCEANPELSELVTELIGDGFKTAPYELLRLSAYADDDDVLKRLETIKLHNKERLTRQVRDAAGLDTSSMFDVQAKRLHEYKRQLLNLMDILARYLELKDNPNLDVPPRTFIFAAKASAGYRMAKEIISLICASAQMINSDPAVSDKIRVAFLEDYRVSLGELLIPASELSEQISTAGKEASGTGNMKFMLNGALTIGTMDGANVEMCEAVGAENMFIFGLRADEAERMHGNGYNPSSVYQNDPMAKRVIDLIASMGNGRYRDIVSELTLYGDRYLLMADFEAYRAARAETDRLYRDTREWNRRALLNIAASCRFAADRSVAEYARDIWHVPVKYAY